MPVISRKSKTFAGIYYLLMPRFTLLFSITALVLTYSCQSPSGHSSDPSQTAAEKPTFNAFYGTPVLDGSGADDVWDQAEWLPIDQIWEGPGIRNDEDFSGRYKLAWDENNLYILAEITDDSLFDIHPEGLDHYEDDDCLEIYIDEDTSGGNFRYSYNAFDYHIAVDGKVSGVAPDSTYRFYDDHCLIRRITKEHVSTWEIAVRIYDGKMYQDGQENVPKLLQSGKKIGIALAYNDNDASDKPKNLIGSVPAPALKAGRAWDNADIFGVLTLN